MAREEGSNGSTEVHAPAGGFGAGGHGPSGEPLTRRGRNAGAYEAFQTWAELPLLILSLLFIPIVVVPLMVSVNQGVENVLSVTSWIIWALFAVEYMVLLWLAPNRIQMARSHVFDLAIILLPFLRPLRASRGLRILRVPFAAGGLGRIATVIRRFTSRRGVRTFAAIVAGSTVLGAAAVYGLEYEHPESDFESFVDVLWWATFTATTIGRTDNYPVTIEGQVIAIMLMALRVSLLAMITANMAAYFVEKEEQEDNAEILTRLDDIESAVNNAQPSQRDADLVERLDRIEKLLSDRDVDFTAHPDQLLSEKVSRGG